MRPEIDEMDRSIRDEIDRRDAATRVSRPVVVTLIAIYEFFGAGVGYFYFAKIWQSHQAYVNSKIGEDPLVYDPFLFGIPIIATILLVLGWGLWRLQKWARHALVASSAGQVVLWLRGALFGQPLFGHRTSPFVLMNLFVLLALLYYPDIGLAFGEKDQ